MDFWIVAGLAAFILGISKGGMPVMAILSVPLLSLYMDPALAAGLLLPLYHVADVYAVHLFRRSFSWANLRILLPAGAVGVAFGYLAISYISGDPVRLLLAGIGLAYVSTTWRNRLRGLVAPPRPVEASRGVVLGALAGLTSYIAHAGGPPYQAYILPQRLEKMRYLGTTTIFFASVNLMKLPAFIAAGQITSDSLQSVLWLAPFAVAGAWSGSRISRWLPQHVFFLLVEIALLLVSVKLLWDVFT
ncbi:UPF0721 transmembrane protein [Jannaschia pagri]|uniref:Probable membrane transporter protein n=1 Tax=Jannaschia pagri TaxID=2829797 RepID=A0ABQ4NHN9_9RHOB|nr:MULTISPECIES: sulfite exporter TauE/SafE family protein [unclassified Jannaschia]GIT89941.1 UPF0721 transmembrane protein [Jannaschia sp. AI_61]GIT93952.1 UPF0721 transmembrane protein [Jannaschia sp. AI_62]